MAKRKPKKTPPIHPNRQACLDTCSDDSLLFADGFDDCIVGVTGGLSNCVVYDKKKMIEELVSQDMDEIDAIEYLEFNTWGAYVGENTPIYIDLI
jgi:hypothetical protein